MAGTNPTNNLHDAQVFEYKQHPWGDLIYGTKEQLQNIGIAVGMAFPGEPDGPKRRLRATDPRGFIAKVEAAEYKGKGLFSASIPFPNRPSRPKYISDFASGVKKEEWPGCDVFTGTAESLTAAGLVRYDQLPGQPGMRKVHVTILADGSLLKGAPTAVCRERWAKLIHRKSKTTYTVYVDVPPEERERREAEHLRANQEWELKMMALPIPEPLCPQAVVNNRPSTKEVGAIPEHLSEDPGYEAAKEASLASPARFNVGDVCVCWQPGHGDHLEKMEITSPFGFRRVNDSDGHFIDKDGDRFSYQWGYLARAIGDESYFYAAHELRDLNYCISHIRLVGAVSDNTNDDRQTAA